MPGFLLSESVGETPAEAGETPALPEHLMMRRTSAMQVQ
jgi:hypothetical protein